MINKAGTVIGWGITPTTTAQLSNIFEQTSMPIVTKTDCLRSKVDFFATFLFETNFCAGSRDGITLSN